MAAKMKLLTYMKANKIDDASMGARVGLSEFGIRKLKYGERRPSIEIALRIQKETGGQVSPEDFITRAAAPVPAPASELVSP